MMAVEFEHAQIVEKIVKNCLERGVITFWFLSAANSFRLAPPLIITEEQIKEAAEEIIEAIEAI
jgi:4-aminobutyrate aminotransferase-like enzyme